MISFRLWPYEDLAREKALYNWLMTLESNTYALGFMNIDFENEDDAITFRLKFDTKNGNA